MRQILVFIFLLTLSVNVYSQELTYQEPDYDLIKMEIQDSSSTYCYSKLLSRLVNFDTTLTNEDYRHLYYGYIFNKDYKPYWRSPDEEKLLKYYGSDKLKERDYDEIINLATHSINEFPFDLRQMNYLAYIYHLKGDEEMAKKISYRFQGIIGAIMSTGDGKTCETGLHVISTSHEYVILNMFQFQFESQALTGDCDYLALVKDERNVEGIYFNIKKLFEKNMEKFKNK